MFVLSRSGLVSLVLFFGFLCFLLLSSFSDATDYYVSPSGKDHNPGTIEKPWETISKVNKVNFDAGDRIFFEGNNSFPGGPIYFNSFDSGAAENPIILSSYGTGRAVISPNTDAGFFAYNTAGIVITNLNFYGSGEATNNKDGINFYNDGKAGAIKELVHIDSVEVTGFGGIGIVIGGWDGPYGYRDVRITNCVSHDNGQAGIHTYAQVPNTHDGVYIGNCFAYNNPGRSDLSYNSGHGILVGGVKGALIERSVAFENGGTGFGSIGIWTYDSTEVIIQYNESHHNQTSGKKDGGGFALDGGVTNSIIQYNYSHDNSGAGFGLFQYQGAPAWSGNTVRYNISQNDGRDNDYSGIQVWNGGNGLSDCEIHNNTIYINASATGSPRAIRFKSATTNFHVRNNIFITAGDIPLAQVASNQSGIQFQGNDYWSIGSTFQIIWYGTKYTSLLEWLNAVPDQGRVDRKIVEKNVNPKLINAGGGGTINDPFLLDTLKAYMLRSTSTMINTGLDLLSLFGVNPGSLDYYGSSIPQSSGYDIGAHEAVPYNRGSR
jgi:Right handed beta helix region